jgi:hypothetical protein
VEKFLLKRPWSESGLWAQAPGSKGHIKIFYENFVCVSILVDRD